MDVTRNWEREMMNIDDDTIADLHIENGSVIH